jgi:four helix bundle protein
MRDASGNRTDSQLLAGTMFRCHSQRPRGSLVEIETQLTIAENLGYLGPKHTRPLFEKASELGKVLNGLIASIKSAA